MYLLPDKVCYDVHFSSWLKCRSINLWFKKMKWSKSAFNKRMKCFLYNEGCTCWGGSVHCCVFSVFTQMMLTSVVGEVLLFDNLLLLCELLLSLLSKLLSLLIVRLLSLFACRFLLRSWVILLGERWMESCCETSAACFSSSTTSSICVCSCLCMDACVCACVRVCVCMCVLSILNFFSNDNNVSHLILQLSILKPLTHHSPWDKPPWSIPSTPALLRRRFLL